MDLCILAFEFLIKGDMSASDMPFLTIYRNQRYLTPELEALNEDFEYTYSGEGRQRPDNN
jgi:hypothetical protein